MTNEPKNRFNCASMEDQLQVTTACRKMLEGTGCDFIISLFPRDNGTEEIVKASVNTMNLVGHFNSIADKVAERLGITREEALRKMAEVGSMTEQSISLD